MDKTLAKGLVLLETLVRHPDLDGIARLARELGWSKSNVHRTLQTLVACGYVTVADGRYAATLRMWTLGGLVNARLDVKQVATPALAAIARETCECAHLAIYDQGEVIYIDEIESPHPVRGHSHIGSRAPSYAVATGKALLAFQPAEAVRSVLGGLHRHSPRTITDPARLAEHLAEIRSTGIAVSRGEWREQVWGIAAPIWDAQDQAVAALGVSGPAERFTAAALERWTPLIARAAAETSARMGRSTGAQGDLAA